MESENFENEERKIRSLCEYYSSFGEWAKGLSYERLIGAAVRETLDCIKWKQFNRNKRQLIMGCLSNKLVAAQVRDWRDPETGNCSANDIDLVKCVLEHCGELLATALNAKQEPPYLHINRDYRPKNAILMLKLFKEKGNADLSLLKNALIADVTKYFRYDSHYSVEALKIFVESNMITEEDITRFDEAAKYAISSFCVDYNQYKQIHYPGINRKFTDCYSAVISKQEYKYDQHISSLLQDRRLHIFITTLPNFVWCMLDRRLGEKEAVVVLQYCSKVLRRPSMNPQCAHNVIRHLLAPCIVKFPEICLAADLPPFCFYQLIEQCEILSYNSLSEEVVSLLLQYADHSLWAPFRNRWNRLSSVRPIFSIEDLPRELIAVILTHATPRIVEMFGVLNKNLNNMYNSYKTAIWRQKYEKEMPYVTNPNLSGKSFRKQMAMRKYRKFVEIIDLTRFIQITSCEAYKQYFVYTHSGGYACTNRETRESVSENIPKANLNARIFNDVLLVRSENDCKVIQIENKSEKKFAITTKNSKKLAFAVDEDWFVCQDGFFDLTSESKLADSHSLDDEFKSCILRDGLCYEETTTKINILDPRLASLHAASCNIYSSRFNSVRYNVIGHSLIVASDKIDIFDTRDLTRPILSSPNLDTPVKFIDLAGMRAFTKNITWNLSDMTYVYQKLPYYFANGQPYVVTNGAEVFSFFKQWSTIFRIERAWNGDYSQYGDFISRP